MQPVAPPSWPSQPPLATPVAPPSTSPDISPGPGTTIGPVSSRPAAPADVIGFQDSQHAPHAPRPVTPGGGRAAVAGVLGILAALMLATANLAGWADSTVREDRTWEGAAVLADETGGLSGLVEERLTEAVTATLDVDGLVGDLLPGPLGALGQPAEGLFDGVVDGVVDDAVAGVLDQPMVQDLIAGYEEDLDQELVDLVRSESDWVHLDEDEVVLDLAPVLEGASRRLEDWGLGALGDDLTAREVEISLGTMPSVTGAAAALDELAQLARLLPLLGLLVVSAAVVVAPDRARVLVLFGTVLAVASVVLLFAELAGSGPLTGTTAPIEDLAGRSLTDVASGPLVGRSLGLAVLGAGVAGTAMAWRHHRQSATSDMSVIAGTTPR